MLWPEQAVQLPRDRPSWPGGSPFQKVLPDIVSSEPFGRIFNDIHLDDNIQRKVKVHLSPNLIVFVMF